MRSFKLRIHISYYTSIGTPLSKHNIILEIINNYIYQHCVKCLRYCLGYTGVV